MPHDAARSKTEQALDRLTDAYGATLALLKASPVLPAEEERALALRLRAASRRGDAVMERLMREQLWRANLRLAWRVAVTNERDHDARLDLFQIVALEMWRKVPGYNPERRGKAGKPARFGTWVMPTLRSVAARARIDAEPVRRPVWVVARERQAARRVRVELQAEGRDWEELTHGEIETRMLAALEAIRDDLLRTSQAALSDSLMVELLSAVAVSDDEALETAPTRSERSERADRPARAFRASAVLAHPPVEVSAGVPAGVSERAYGQYSPFGAFGGYGHGSHGAPMAGESAAEGMEGAYRRSVERGYTSDPFAEERPNADAMAERGGLLESLSPETAELVGQLTGQQTEVLRLRYEQGLEFKEIGRLLDPPVTRSRVGQIHDEALARLRGLDAAQGGKLQKFAAPRQPTKGDTKQ